jgi:hypothetical protein
MPARPTNDRRRRHLVGVYVDYDEFGTCLRKHGITPPPIARALLAPCSPVAAASDNPPGALASFGLQHQHQQRQAVVAAAATEASRLRAAL